jgi:hypothetical protein
MALPPNIILRIINEKGCNVDLGPVIESVRITNGICQIICTQYK